MEFNLPHTPFEFLGYMMSSLDADDLDRVCHLLSNRRRRLVIVRVFVLSPSETVSSSTLAREIAAIETETEFDAVSGDAYEAVRNGLIQSHLPTLADAEIITYDERSKRVGRGPDVPAVGVALAALIVILRLLSTPEDESVE